ncbi:MAG: transcriptional regulator [Thermoprotei archaeon]
MNRDQAIGILLLLVSIVVIIAYLWLMWFPLWKGVDLILLKLTGSAAIVVLFGIVGWIGYTLATTPPPKPIEEIEKEIEEELKKIEKEVKEETEKKGETESQEGRNTSSTTSA